MSQNSSYQRQVVTAVIVAHDGARLLPGLIQAIGAQTRPVDRAVGVDTGSGDRSGALLAELLGSDVVFGMDPGTGFGAAVARALQHPAARRITGAREIGVQDEAVTEWIWLLHDDCQPAPDALEHLLRTASRYDTAGVLGPKLRDLADRRVLREVGLTMDRAGRRLTGIEAGEIDQGQHDGNRPVLAVSSAGMLVRRDVWDQLGGFDPLLPLFRDDIDFCWRAHAAGHDVRVVTEAIVYHRELSGRHSRRPGIVASGHPRLLDRRSALYVFAVNLPVVPLLTVVGGCVIGSLLRAAYFLLTKQQRRALGHLGALAWLFGHPLQVWRGRSHRAAGRKRAYAVLRPQLPHGKTLSRMAESAVGVLSRNSPYEGSGQHSGAVTDDPDDDLPLPPPDSVIRRVLTNPGVLLFACLAVITFVAERSVISSLFRGSGTLAGGALVPAWGGASDLWREYLAGYHVYGVGSSSSTPPYLAVIAAVATVFGGKPWLAVDVLLLGCVPIAGMAAFGAARQLTQALAARIWIALSYALLPVATGAVAAGRLGTAVAFMLLPLIGLVVGRIFTRAPRPEAQANPTPRAARRAAWGAGLLIAIAAAFVPLLWLIAAAAGVVVLGIVAFSQWRGSGSVGRLGWAVAVNAAIVVVVPAALLAPWTLHLITSPSAFLLQAGVERSGLTATSLRPQPLLLLSPGGPGLPPVWVTGGLLLAAFCALVTVRPDSGRRRVLVLTGWGVALTGLAIAAVVSRLRVTSPVTGNAVPAWPGIALAIAAAGLLLAATPVLEWAAGVAWGMSVSQASLATRARLVGRRGTAALVLGAVAVTAPILAAGYWLATGVRGPLSAAGTPVLPPFVAASSASQGQVRTLVLRREQGVLTYQVLRNSDPLLGEPELAEVSAPAQALGSAVASLAATGGGTEDAAQSLSQFAIGYVLLPAPVDQALARQINGVAGLAQLTVSSAYDLWRVTGTVARLRVISTAGVVMSVPSGTVGANAVVAPSAAGTLVLAESAGGWSATLNGRTLTALSRPVDGWAQGFVLPKGGGRLVITRNDTARDLALGGEAAALLIVFVLALPGTRGASTTAAAAASVELPDAGPAEPGPAEPELPEARPVEVDVEPRPSVVGAGVRMDWPPPASEAGFGRDADPRPARKRGGSHRAARHGKPSRGWRAKTSGSPRGSAVIEPPGSARTEVMTPPYGVAEWPEAEPWLPDGHPSGPDTLAAGDWLVPGAAAEANSPKETESAPEAPWDQPPEPPGSPEQPPASSGKPPWELGDMP